MSKNTLNKYFKYKKFLKYLLHNYIKAQNYRKGKNNQKYFYVKIDKNIEKKGK